MSNMMIAQVAAASSFASMALVYLIVWVRVRNEPLYLLFGVTSIAAGANALAEASLYSATTIEDSCVALRYYVGTSGIWAISIVIFLVVYSRPSRVGQSVAVVVGVICAIALVLNATSQTSFLFETVESTRAVELQWLGTIHLPVGEPSRLRIYGDVALMAILGIVVDGAWQIYSRGQRFRGVMFGVTCTVFAACFGTHAYLVDTESVESPYLSTYGFLAIALFMTYDFAGQVLRKFEMEALLASRAKELENAVVAERQRIAAELHDSVLQSIFSAHAIAATLPDIWERQPSLVLKGLAELKRIAKTASTEMRSLLVELHSHELTRRSIGKLLHQLTQSTSARYGKPICSKIDVDPELPPSIQVALYRIAQESLNNAMKHSKAENVGLSFSQQADGFELQIQDDGIGFDETAVRHSGLGLTTLRTRARDIGGELTIATGDGTTVTLTWRPKSK